MHILTSFLSLALVGISLSTSLNASTTPFDLTIAHINDHHSHLQEEKISWPFTLHGKETNVDLMLGGFPRISTTIKEIAHRAQHPLLLHAGDAITGDLYYTLFTGKADADLMNTVCFDAFVPGNHEFDNSDKSLRDFIDYLHDSSCQTPIISANVVPAQGTPLAPSSEIRYLQPYTIKDYDGEKVGIIGITASHKTQNSSRPLKTTQFLDESKTSQHYIDELTAMGVNKIVLLSHYGYSNDLAMAKKLTGVDVIVGGDSHTLLGTVDRYGLNHAASYPTISEDKNGKKVCVVQAWEYAHMVGELNVQFDENGDVLSCTGNPHFPLGETFKVDGVQVSGEDKAALLAAIEADPQLSLTPEDEGAKNVLAGFSQQVNALKKQVIGTAAENLCLERIPGQGKSTLCTTSATAVHGSDIVNIVAKAFRAMSLRSDIAIQNGGGVRVDIAQGDITLGDAYTLLPFANTLIEFSMTGQQIIDLLEEAYAYAIAPHGSSGAYPYASGLRWDLDGSQAKGSRFTHVQVKGKKDLEWKNIDPKARYIVVTNSYIAGGKDGYTTFARLAPLDTYLDYTKSFVDYVKSVQTVTKLDKEEYSTQRYTGPVD